MQKEVRTGMMLAKSLKFVWVLCSLAVFVVTLAYYAPGKPSDIGVFFVYGMLFWAFPVSLLVAGLFALLALIQEQSGVPLLDLIGSNYMGFFVMWLAFFVAGYAQWFVLLPWLWRKWKIRKARGYASST
jgi:hypothetical protein